MRRTTGSRQSGALLLVTIQSSTAQIGHTRASVKGPLIANVQTSLLQFGRFVLRDATSEHQFTR